MTNLETIYNVFIKKFKCSFLDVDGDEQHIFVTIVSNEFEGLSRLERHRVVNDVVKELFQDKIHALSLKIFTDKEWQK